MRYRARAYPYPMLSPFSHDFDPAARFSVEVSPEIAGERGQMLKLATDVHLTETWFDELIVDGNARLMLDVECRETLYRAHRPIARTAGVCEFIEGELAGAVTVTPLIIATTDIEHYKPPRVNAEYHDASFTVSAGDILAIGEATIFEIDFGRSAANNLVTIQYSADLTHRGVYTFDLSGPRIIIIAGEDLREAIWTMRTDPTKRPFLHMSVYKDCIAAALDELTRSEDDDEDRAWSRALRNQLDDLQPPGVLDREHPETQQILAQRLMSARGIKAVKPDES